MSVVRRLAVLLTFATLAIGPTAALGQGASPLSGHGRVLTPARHDRGRSGFDPAAHHSLRQPVTDQNFYFVMADRFENGDTANDNGGLPPAPVPASRGSTRPGRAGTTAATSRA